MMVADSRRSPDLHACALCGICVDADGRARRSMRRIHRLRLRLRHAVHLRDLAVEVEVGWSPASYQPCASTECQILYRPLNENENATLERNQIGYMDKSPNQPR